MAPWPPPGPAGHGQETTCLGGTKPRGRICSWLMSSEPWCPVSPASPCLGRGGPGKCECLSAHPLLTERGSIWHTGSLWWGARSCTGETGKTQKHADAAGNVLGAGVSRGGCSQGLEGPTHACPQAASFPGPHLAGRSCARSVGSYPHPPTLWTLSPHFPSPSSENRCPRASGNHMFPSLKENSDLKYSHPTSNHVSRCCGCPKAADTGPTLSNRGGSGRGPGGGHRFKRVAPGKQGFTKQTNPVDWAGPVWSGLQNESSTQGTASSATTGWLAWAGGWGRWPSSQHGAGPPPLLQPRPLSVLASAPPGTSPVATHPQDVRFPTGKMGIILLTSQSCC